jgi:hypothetical protein
MCPTLGRIILHGKFFNQQLATHNSVHNLIILSNKLNFDSFWWWCNTLCKIVFSGLYPPSKGFKSTFQKSVLLPSLSERMTYTSSVGTPDWASLKPGPPRWWISPKSKFYINNKYLVWGYHMKSWQYWSGKYHRKFITEFFVFVRKDQ